MDALTAAQALNLAIESQAAAARFYAVLADRADDPKTQTLLSALADLQEHQGHELRAIEGLLVARSPFVGSGSAMHAYESALCWESPQQHGARESMQAALQLEREASVFFDSLADRFTRPGGNFIRTIARSRECFADLLENAIRDLQFKGQHSFSFREAMRNAVQAEHACAWVYRGLMTRTRDPRAREFLDNMVRFAEVQANEIERLGLSVGDAHRRARHNLKDASDLSASGAYQSERCAQDCP